MIIVGQDIATLTLGRLIAIGLMVLVVIIALFSLKGFIRTIISCILLIIAMAHYTVLALSTRYVNITILPLLIVERYREYSVFYVDYGQLSILLLLLLWRNKIKSIKTLIRRINYKHS